MNRDGLTPLPRHSISSLSTSMSTRASIDILSDGEYPSDRIAVVDEFHEAYEQKGELGKGLSSVVCRCVHRASNATYAVKIIDKTHDKAILTSVRAEIDILECVNHDHIIKLREWFESPVYFFLVFELASHGELFDQLNKAIRFSEVRSKLVMKQLFLALEHVHSKGIVHRDVKPENILLGQNFLVKLSDFGFAQKIDDDKSLRDLCGTPGYMAPEVLKVTSYEDAPGYGRPVDLWACGVILFTMLAGFPPFWHRKMLMMLRHIMEGRYTFEAPEWKGVSDSAKDLIRRLLVVKPEDRLNITQALNHPFILEEGTRSKRRRMVLNRFVGAVDAIVVAHALNRTLEDRRSATNSVTSSPNTSRAGCESMACSTTGSPPSPLRDSESDEIPTVETAPDVPYEHSLIRSAIDGVAFHVYGHWVKKGDQQNRAAMFENHPKLVALRVRNRMGGGLRTPMRLSPDAFTRPSFSPLPQMPSASG